ncbi:MAG TPA: OmpA family protein [Gemmatimonadales bacterium]|nr:OmpA family protein [Gemmatimonadales bacterium]
MNQVTRVMLVGGIIAFLVGCGKTAPPPTPAPASKPNADSLAAVEKSRSDSLAAAAERARRDSLAEAERLAAEHKRMEDSLAAAAREHARATLTAMIHFETGRASIRPEDAMLLDEKLAILSQHGDAKIRVSGYCDERGSDAYNQKLGMRRAEAAKQYLVKHGIDASRIETTSLGKKNPVASGHDEAAWSQNRRDEFEILSGTENMTQ